ncbi:hypothetical protein EV363DRAFT_1396574 [Boletus edulis]|nr:hypothetical protein EV363DRAFT_1396574 [Boletus edulis]
MCGCVWECDHLLDIVVLMSTVDSLIPLPVIPEHRRRQSPDVIDIDAPDADDVVYVGSARPTQRRRVGDDGRAVPVTREVINLSDSEDDNEIEFIGRNPARPQPPLVRRHRIFSPPPPPQIGGIPPVPPIPQRFLPLRPRPPPGVIIPNEDPLPFEADLRPPPAEQPGPVAAAPSHHVPSMGFGGALLAGVRRIIGPRNTPQRLERRNSWGVSGSFIMRWDPFDFVGDQENELLDGFDEIGFLGEQVHPFAAGRVRSQIEVAFKQRDRTEPDYKPEYTHPERPLPGFTHDFSLSPSPSSSPVTEEDDTSPSRLASTSGTQLCEVTLVCASCQDPLVVGAADVGEDRAKRKLWGLRCGHLIDGKCIQKLMEPRMAAEQEQCSPSSSQDTAVVDPHVSSMRSRLRPRRGMPGFPPHAVPAGLSLSGGRRGTPAVTQRNNRKGKGKMKAPAVDAEHEWNCPVSGCGRVHLSLSVDGRWTMDERRGAIAVFAVVLALLFLSIIYITHVL